MPRGKFIVIEGVDQSGKDTQALCLLMYLEQKNLSVWQTFEPTRDNWWGILIHFLLKQKIKIPQMLFQKMYFFDRRLHVKKIWEKLQAGYNVIAYVTFSPLLPMARLNNLTVIR